jgi:hypothetical protein
MLEINSKIKEYFYLQYNEKINEPFFLNYVCDKNIEGKNYSVNISNRALKHFVESRKESFAKNHSNEYALEKMIKMFSLISVVIENGKVELNKNKTSRISIKYDLKEYGMRKHVIACEKIENRLEIVSYHPTK